MSCEHCTDPSGVSRYPSYGVAPHTCDPMIPGATLGGNGIAPHDRGPANFTEDRGNPGHGIYWCAHCGAGKPPEKIGDVNLCDQQLTAPGFDLHTRQFEAVRRDLSQLELYMAFANPDELKVFYNVRAFAIASIHAESARHASSQFKDARSAFEHYITNRGRGDCVDYVGDGLYKDEAVNIQSDAFKAGAEWRDAVLANRRQTSDEPQQDVANNLLAAICEEAGYSNLSPERIRELMSVHGLAFVAQTERLADASTPIPTPLPDQGELAKLRSRIEQLEAMLEDRVARKPNTDQEWARHDGAIAFHLIERHADNWNDAGNMMEAWARARVSGRSPDSTEKLATPPAAQAREAQTVFGIPAHEMTPEQHARAASVNSHFDEPFDSHPDDVARVHASMDRYVKTGELPDSQTMGPIDANKLEMMAREMPDECFLKGSGVLKLIEAIRQLETQVHLSKQASVTRSGDDSACFPTHRTTPSNQQDVILIGYASEYQTDTAQKTLGNHPGYLMMTVRPYPRNKHNVPIYVAVQPHEQSGHGES